MFEKIFNILFKIDELVPIKDWHTNNVLKGVKNKEGVTVVPDLPITQCGDGKTISVWKTTSFRTRLKFLFTGKVNFQILAPTHAPIAISIGEYEGSNTGEENE